MIISRRTFVAGGTALLAARPFAWAADSPHVLSGTRFDLEISAMPVNLTGSRRTAIVVNGQLPAPLLRWREGDDITIRVTNRLRERTSIHWHGIILPADMDGVPGLSFHGIAPGETFTYRFRVNQSGTYWYHSHSRFQEQLGLYGAIVVEPREPEHHGADREHVLLLSDWTDRNPESLYRTLKTHSDYFNFSKRTARDFFEDVDRTGLADTVAERSAWGQMRMDPTDLADVSAYAYTYLLNGLTPQANWTGTFARGERVRMRLINGASMTYFDFRVVDLPMSVVAADGQDVDAVTVDELRIGPAEVYDVIVEPKDDRAYTIFAQSMDRSGYARGTLAPRAGMEAAVPSPDRRPLLSMSDMGMSHAGEGHEGHGAGGRNFGPQADMSGIQPSTRLDDPGIGLRANGRRVLTYADLHTIGGPIDARDAGREIELHLTGHMERFVWSFDGQKFSEAEPLRFRHGERLRIALVNNTMMTHPIHLHGMWSEVESSEGRFHARKHTVTVQPAQRLSYLVTADALGRWAYHCHLLYHMEAGMFREVIVEPGAA
jgi:FtsP/CotA-like multicopper oxidase with cupredoxin domain